MKSEELSASWRSEICWQDVIYPTMKSKKKTWFHTDYEAAVVDEVHKSSTWVKVQIHIIKYYSSKSTDFSILLEWKYKSTQFFMYLSKKVPIDLFSYYNMTEHILAYWRFSKHSSLTAQNAGVSVRGWVMLTLLNPLSLTKNDTM